MAHVAEYLGNVCPFRSMTADADGWSWELAASGGRMAAGLFGFSLPFRRAGEEVVRI
jgi:hypothetical protein